MTNEQYYRPLERGKNNKLRDEEVIDKVVHKEDYLRDRLTRFENDLGLIRGVYEEVKEKSPEDTDRLKEAMENVLLVQGVYSRYKRARQKLVTYIDNSFRATKKRLVNSTVD